MTAMPVIVFLFAVVLSPAAHADDRWLQREIKDKKMDYIMNEASLDISADVDLWVQLGSEVDASYGLGWRHTLARKIPSQPVGVIEIAARTDYPASQLCTVPFIEEEDYIVDRWCRRSIEALESFVMVDGKREAIRRQCLEEIRANYEKTRANKG